MNKDIFEENDRNIRVFGIETQKKLFESTVLITNITPMMSELCKNLILSGAGICLYDDTSKIAEKDCENNFFFNIGDLGKNKAEILKSKIKTFKESCRIDIIHGINEINNLGIKYGVMDLSEDKLDDNVKKEIEKIMNDNKNILYYVKIEKDKAIFLNNILEKKFLEKNENENKNKDETRFVKDEKIIDHMDLSDDDEEDKPNNNDEKKQNEKSEEKTENKNDTKVIDITSNNEDEEKKIEILNENDYLYLDINQKIKDIKELIPKNMKKNEEKVINDAFSVINNETNNKDGNINNVDKKNPLNCLTNYVIGGVVCHEIINCISKKKNPRTNVYYYDSFIGTGKFLNELYDKVLDN